MKLKSDSKVPSVVSDSSLPHGLQPTRLLHPWDFPARVLEWGAIVFSDTGPYMPGNPAGIAASPKLQCEVLSSLVYDLCLQVII